MANRWSVKQDTTTVSAYCPICAVKTVQSSVASNKYYRFIDGMGYHTVPVYELCCSDEHAQLYRNKVASYLDVVGFDRRGAVFANLVELGVIPDPSTY